jgi:2-oxo-4-hydroxy-4-carboxy-5-ureidoimidazoline decarboxylase
MSIKRLNALPDLEARELLLRCCGATRWVDGMLQSRPFESMAGLHGAADAVWERLGSADYLEAFAHHPEIGADVDELRRKFATTAELSRSEQEGAADASESTLLGLRDGNHEYRERFGYSFIVCATGKSADEMLLILRARLENAPARELGVAAAEQSKITHLRLEKLAR